MGAGCCSTKSKVHTDLPENDWGKVMKVQKLEDFIKNNPGKVKNMLYRGVPSSLRWEVWLKLFGITNSSEEYLEVLNKATLDETIDRDLHRTFPQNELLSSPEGQKNLKNLLNALSNKYSEQGYWQGMNYITGTLLILSTGNECETFGLMSQLYKDFGVLTLFEKDFGKIRTFCQRFHESVKKHDKELETHVENIGLHDELWVFKWFITMFTYSFPFKTVLRIWDGLFAMNIDFMVNIAVSIALSISSDLKSKSLETVLSYLETLEIDIEKVLYNAKSYVFITTPTKL